MRELRETGWISNRARMIAAQFLAKHLRVDWRRGERVFRDWLFDGDVASNVGNWQWAAGLGIDNAPYFRVFNPISQGRQHDRSGAWLRRWVPESDGDPQARPDAIVDVGEARKRYLEAAREVSGNGTDSPATRRPPIRDAIAEQLTVVPGVGTSTADSIVTTLAMGGRLEDAHGVGPATVRALARVFELDGGPP
jgi:hypothetical protein